jgi:hypothetical protein
MERSASATASEGHRAAAARAALIVAFAGCHSVFGLDEVGPPTADAGGDDVRDAAAVDAACGGHDEDLDGIPDNCDSCPHVVDLGVDTDGDGIDDACDPHKMQAGDHLAAFYAFAEGEPELTILTTPFAHVARTNGDLVVTADANRMNEETLALVPDLVLVRVTVIARATVSMTAPPTVGSANSSGLWAQVSGPGTRTTLPLGLVFEGYESNPMGQPRDDVHVFDTVTALETAAATPTTIDGPLEYRLSCDDIDAPTCTGYITAGGLAKSVAMPTGYEPSGGQVGLRTHGLAATAWHYLVVYTFGTGGR